MPLDTSALETRERRLDDAAGIKGLVVSKARVAKQGGRYLIVDPHVKKTKSSLNPEFPYSFSLEEAEAFVANVTT